MSAIPYLSVVIPTYNRIETLLSVLDAIGHQAEAPGFELILVNDGSSDDTASRVERGIEQQRWRFPLLFHSQDNGGPGNARNAGTARARGRFIVYIGDDTIPEASFLREHARVHLDSADDAHVACLGYTGWPDGERVTAFMEYINDYGLQFGYKLIEHRQTVPFNFFYTSNISIAREILGNSPFDTTFPAAAWEDIELAWRLDKQGLRIEYNANAVTRHHHPMTVDSFARRQYTVGKSAAIFFDKHPELDHFLGVRELEARRPAGDLEMSLLRLRARAGEEIRNLAQPKVFERLMREHYLRGLRDGLREQAR